MSLKNAFPCNTCGRVFESSQAQRTHMREPWHVYNLKRRMADLPPISADVYAETVATSLVSSSKQESSLDAAASSSEVVRPSLPPEEERAEESEEVEGLIDEQGQINRCLFCTKDSDSLETNVEHMFSEHGLYIPEIEHLSSLETTVGYLRTVITEYNECLYCGVVKHSAEGVRRHMLDKGHCMINLEREPELLEFWEFSDGDDGDDTDTDDDDDDEEAPKSLARKKTDTVVASRDLLSQGEEYALPSGKVVRSKRSKARDARRLFARRTTTTALAAANENSSSRTITEGPIDDNTDKASSAADSAESRRRTQGGGTQDRGAVVAVRDAVGLVGVSDQQIRSLITVQRKMQRQQAIVAASAAWAGDKGGIHQRHYKVKMNLRAG